MRLTRPGAEARTSTGRPNKASNEVPIFPPRLSGAVPFSRWLRLLLLRVAFLRCRLAARLRRRDHPLRRRRHHLQRKLRRAIRVEEPVRLLISIRELGVAEAGE